MDSAVVLVRSPQEYAEARLAELNRSAANAIRISSLVPLKSYLRSANAVYTQAKAYLRDGDHVTAYMMYLRFCKLVIKDLPQHPQAKAQGYESQWAHLKARCLKALDVLETLKPELLAQFARDAHAVIAQGQEDDETTHEPLQTAVESVESELDASKEVEQNEVKNVPPPLAPKPRVTTERRVPVTASTPKRGASMNHGVISNSSNNNNNNFNRVQNGNTPMARSRIPPPVPRKPAEMSALPTENIGTNRRTQLHQLYRTDNASFVSSISLSTIHGPNEPNRDIYNQDENDMTYDFEFSEADENETKSILAFNDMITENNHEDNGFSGSILDELDDEPEENIFSDSNETMTSFVPPDIYKSQKQLMQEQEENKENHGMDDTNDLKDSKPTMGYVRSRRDSVSSIASYMSYSIGAVDPNMSRRSTYVLQKPIAGENESNLNPFSSGIMESGESSNKSRDKLVNSLAGLNKRNSVVIEPSNFLQNKNFIHNKMKNLVINQHQQQKFSPAGYQTRIKNNGQYSPTVTENREINGFNGVAPIQENKPAQSLQPPVPSRVKKAPPAFGYNYSNPLATSNRNNSSPPEVKDHSPSYKKLHQNDNNNISTILEESNSRNHSRNSSIDDGFSKLQSGGLSFEDATLAACIMSVDEKPPSFTEFGTLLRKIILPQNLVDNFTNIASYNTDRNTETCGILAGFLNCNIFVIDSLYIPKQTGTPDSCTMIHEEELFLETDKRGRIVLGWIHTHPTQSCFLSSVDLHTHAGFQLLLPEAISIVVAPKHTPSVGVYRLTDPPGLPLIAECPKTGFHPHDMDQFLSNHKEFIPFIKGQHNGSIHLTAQNSMMNSKSHHLGEHVFDSHVRGYVGKVSARAPQSNQQNSSSGGLLSKLMKSKKSKNNTDEIPHNDLHINGGANSSVIRGNGIYKDCCAQIHPSAPSQQQHQLSYSPQMNQHQHQHQHPSLANQKKYDLLETDGSHVVVADIKVQVIDLR